jgi:hypothetical protein
MTNDEAYKATRAIPIIPGKNRFLVTFGNDAIFKETWKTYLAWKEKEQV